MFFPFFLLFFYFFLSFVFLLVSSLFLFPFFLFHSYFFCSHVSFYLFLFSLFFFVIIISLFFLFSLRNYDPGFCVSYATVPVPFALSYIWYLRCDSRVSPGFSHPRSLPLLLSFLLTLSSSDPALYISRYYCIPTARISEMKSTLFLTLPSTVSSILLLFLLSHHPPLLKAWRGCYADRNSI